jgi:formylglycine-generating enzyme required for sulfatase activity
MEPMPISSQALPAGTRIEEFVIERVLGSGGFGITYLARDVRLGRQVVIKENLPVQFCFRDPSSLTVAPRHTTGEDLENFRWSLENFSKESAMLASLDHVGIVKVLRSFEAFGTAYFVMPFVEGVTLDELHKERREAGEGFSEDELRGMLERVLDGLAHLHDRGIYHRDIKPENILITSEGVPVLIDFGSARQRLSERSMTVVESAGYTPFEQLQSRGNVGPWSDLYALAATLVKVMTGEAPPKANDRTMGDPWQPLTGRAELRGTYAAGFLGGLDKALRLQVEERWQDAREWQRGLVSGEVGVKSVKRAAPAEEIMAPAQKHASRARRVLWALGGGALLLVLAGWYFTRGEQDMAQGAKVVAAVTGAASGGLVITSDPSGAVVQSSSGEVLGQTPMELKGLEGGSKWQGKLTLAGYDTAEVGESVVSGETKLVKQVQMEASRQKWIVTSDPSGAEVLVEGKTVGKTPCEGPACAVGSEVKLELRKEGYAVATAGGEVELGKTLMLQAKLVVELQGVKITSDPSGAEVREAEGERVLGKTPLEIPEVLPGTVVRYRLALTGHEETSVTGKVALGQGLALTAKLKAQPQSKLAGERAGEEREFEIAPGVKMAMCWCPAGEFVMGSLKGEMGRSDDETQHRVKLSKGFWLAKTETTQAQWQAVMGNNPSRFNGGSLPVERVSWNDAQEFISRLNAKLALSDGMQMTLPTEAQWEYAARAGEPGPYSGGTLDQVGWYGENSGVKTHAVGGKKPNGWGLHDMHGNVYEWCTDWYDKQLTNSTDPAGAASGTRRVFRGGGWGSFAVYCRVAYRNNGNLSYSGNDLGFRVARSSVQ